MLLVHAHPLSSKVLENHLKNFFYILRTIFCLRLLTISFLIPSIWHKISLLKEISRIKGQGQPMVKNKVAYFQKHLIQMFCYLAVEYHQLRFITYFLRELKNSDIS